MQALWLNALLLASKHPPRYAPACERGCAPFRARFWNEQGEYLYDVIDVGHQRGEVDASLRPNQIFAVGELPMVLLPADQARCVVDVVEQQLWTPIGLRSLEQPHPNYRGRYIGGPAQRDAVYHQGTVWPWLIGPFVEAWLRVHGASLENKREAGRRFVEPLKRHLDDGGLSHISEIADGDAPHMSHGCPFQAWSVGELIRLERTVLCGSEEKPRRRSRHPSRSTYDDRPSTHLAR
ncbi:MAG TPA: amylo-alpha-1,6-glucosidase [Tepidisphaeraceae bacterium]|nr:amylo-alpha-1,6-glucosidase [Tepidisphaeraceae bacterium]